MFTETFHRYIQAILIVLLIWLINPGMVSAADQHSAEYGTATTIRFCVRDADELTSYTNADSFTTGDCASSACCKTSTNGGAITDCDNQPTALASSNCFALTASAAELTGATADYFIQDAGDPDRFGSAHIEFKTWGLASAYYPYPDVNITEVAGSSVSGVNDFKADVSGLATAAALTTHDGKLDVVDGNVDDIETLANTIDGKVDTVDGNVDTVVGALPTNFADLAITATTGRVTVGTNNDKTNYTLSDASITAAKFGAGAIDAAAVNDNLKGSTYSASTDTIEHIRDAIDNPVSLANDGLDASDITADAANKIADHILRRNSDNIEASSDGDALQFKSLYGAIAKQTHCIAVSGSDLVIKKDDCSTDLESQTLTTDENAAPITGIATP